MIPLNTPTVCVITDSVFLTGDKPMVLIGLKPKATKGPTDPMTYAISLGNPKAAEISTGELKMAFPSLLSLTSSVEEVVDRIAFQNALLGAECIVTRVPQRDDASRYNYRIASKAAEAPKEDRLALIKAMMAKGPKTDISSL